MKHCNGCDRDLPPEAFGNYMKNVDGLQTQCKECLNKTNRDWYKRRIAAGWKDPGNTSRAQLRKVILDVLGRECVCCGETIEEFLTIDHIGGGGNAHIRETGNTYRMLLDIIRQGVPRDKFRTLCFNCNLVTKHGVVCPHERINVSSLVAGMAC